MTSHHVSRRDFVKLAGAAASLGLVRPFPPAGAGEAIGQARVASSYVNLWSEASFAASQLARLKRDQLITLVARELSDEGPFYNPVWYRTADGYVHSGNIQLVEWNIQQPVTRIPEEGCLFEISVPYTRSYMEPDTSSRALYRLYYQSTAWVDGIETGADGRPWYRLIDHQIQSHYFARAEHLRRVGAEELMPISPDVPANAKRVEVILRLQELRAYEFEELVFRTRISSGILSYEPGPNGIPLATPQGNFRIHLKTAVRHMGDGRLTSDLRAYELPGVPWCCFFHETGVAFHGTYWHNDFGTPRSHGCVNMQSDEAKWLYRWSQPVVDTWEMARSGSGTRVYVTW